jgi:hypothetical protein
MWPVITISGLPRSVYVMVVLSGQSKPTSGNSNGSVSLN